MTSAAGYTTEASAIVRDVRDQTVEVCIRTIESLYADSQGLTLDGDTIDACVAILRNLKALGSHANENQE